MSSNNQIGAIVIIGVGGLGVAIAKRIGAGRRLILADYSEASLERAKEQLEEDGHIVDHHSVDIADPASVQGLAIYASQLGRIEAVIHTAGLSPTMAPPERIFEVDLLGTAVVIEMFESVLAPGGSLVCIVSIAGHMLTQEISPDVEAHLALAPDLVVVPAESLVDGVLVAAVWARAQSVEHSVGVENLMMLGQFSPVNIHIRQFWFSLFPRCFEMID